MKEYSKTEEDKNKKRRIIFYIILILLLLLLITSCTSNFFGKIGDLFRNEKEVEINPGTQDKEIILNKELKFYKDKFEIYLSDSKTKLGFYYERINPSEIICSTSDANIATCYVEDDYVVIIPKRAGEVEIILQTETNGKIYKATSKVTIKESNQAINLFNNEDTIYINYTNEKVLSFSLEGITGKITVTSSDETIAKAYIENGVIKIIPLRPGTVIITVTIENNGVITEKKYTLHIKGDEIENLPPTNRPGNNSGNNNNPIPNPSPEKDKNNFIKSLTMTPGTLNFDPNTTVYYVGVSKDIKNVSFNCILSSDKSKVSYMFNNQPIYSLNNLPLKAGNNKLMISVIAEDGSLRIYEVNINRESDKDNSLKNIIIENHELRPTFHKDTLNYSVVVESDIEKITANAILSNPNATIKYKWNNETVSSLKDLNVKPGTNELEIEVIGEDGVSRTYHVTVTKKLSNDNTLSELKVIGGTLNEPFSKDRENYTVNVPYNTDNIAMTLKPTDPHSSISYQLNGNKIDNLTNIPLKEGDNTLEITITAENGEQKTYTVTIHRPTRTITIENIKSEIDFEEIPFPLVYNVYDDGILTSDFDYHDIEVKFSNYKGNYTIEKNYIVLDPDPSMIGKSTEIEVIYQNKTVKTNVNFTMKNYVIEPETNNYTINFDQGESFANINLNTNMFSYGTKVTPINGGIRISSSKDDRIYIDVTTNSNIISLSSKDEPSKVSTIAIKATANQSGTATLNISGTAFGKVINSTPVNVTVIKKYELTIDANTGFFQNHKTDIISFKLSNTETINLADYQAYKEATGNCMYYELDHFNTKRDGTGEKYQITDSITNLTQDLTLYAIYKQKDPSYIELIVPDHYYVYDKDDRGIELFHNEAYFQKYGKDKMIYPGAKGSYVQTIMNKNNSQITLTGINLEEDTICIPNKGCLNMGYVIKYSPNNSNNTNYYYGSSTKYQILNKDPETTIDNTHTSRFISFEPNTISIPDNGGAEISLLWEWVGEDDELDTKIGEEATNLNNKYTLTVRIDFTRLHSHCTIK